MRFFSALFITVFLYSGMQAYDTYARQEFAKALVSGNYAEVQKLATECDDCYAIIQKLVDEHSEKGSVSTHVVLAAALYDFREFLSQLERG